MSDFETIFYKEHSDESPGIKIYYNKKNGHYSPITSATIPNSLKVRIIGKEISKLISIKNMQPNGWSDSIVYKIEEDSDRALANLLKVNFPETITYIFSTLPHQK